MSAQITVKMADKIVTIKVVGKPTLQEILDVGIGLAEGDKFVVGGVFGISKKVRLILRQPK